MIDVRRSVRRPSLLVGAVGLGLASLVGSLVGAAAVPGAALAAPTKGSLIISNVAPASAQTITFTFGIYCSGVAGSPFTVEITGTGTSGPVKVHEGSQCLASQSHKPVFLDEPNQSYNPVEAGQSQTVTFHQAFAPPRNGALTVTNVSPDSAQFVTFEFGIYCSGVEGSPFTVQVTGSDVSRKVLVPVGSSCLASETRRSDFAVQQNKDYGTVEGGETLTVTFHQHRI